MGVTQSKQMGATTETIPLPKPYERFEREHMSARVLGIFERISQIWDIPFSMLPPFFGEGLKKSMFRRQGEYSNKYHRVRLASPTSVNVEHELAHSAMMLVNPDSHNPPGVSFGKWKRFKLSLRGVGRELMYEAFKEPLANAGESIRPPSSLHPAFLDTSLLMVLGLTKPLAASFGLELALVADCFMVQALMGGALIGSLKRDKSVRDLYDKYGPDGLILLSVKNPHRLFKYGLRVEEEWFLTEGLLAPSEGTKPGRLTPKGEDYLRRTMPREEILKRLRCMEDNLRASIKDNS